jgi:DNA helicase MCM8
MHVLYIEANSIMHGFINKQQQQQQQQKITNNADQSFATNADFGKDQISFDMRDLHAIREIANEPDLFRLLVHSLCPSIYGHEMVKAGLLLALFGGRQRHNEASSGGGDSSVHIRGDSHVLIVGDPGLGKSQMLSAVAQTAPRGVYVCSNTTTSSGLTVTLTKEPGSNEFSLEAGALVLGDQVKKNMI